MRLCHLVENSNLVSTEWGRFYLMLIKMGLGRVQWNDGGGWGNNCLKLLIYNGFWDLISTALLIEVIIDPNYLYMRILSSNCNTITYWNKCFKLMYERFWDLISTLKLSEVINAPNYLYIWGILRFNFSIITYWSNNWLHC